MENEIVIASTADWHLGNPRINVESFYNKLRKYLYPELGKAHVLFLAGDLYDQLLTVNSKAHRFATIILRELMAISAKTGLQIRLLHGTYTHDRDQLNIFESMTFPLSRFKVIDTIFAEEIDDLRNEYGGVPGSLKVLYIPDNLPYKHSNDAIDQCKEVLTCLGWTSVDVVVGHGTFEHVIPPDSGHRPPCLYRLEQFNEINPHGPIIMGHIHTPGKMNRVHYCGSFDRMSHGEEEDKGFYVLSKSDLWRSRFVANGLATPFISIAPIGNDVSEITEDFLSKMDDRFPVKRGHVRVIHQDPEIRSLLHKLCAQQFPDILYSSKSSNVKETATLKMDEIALDVFEDVKPDIHNLGKLVFYYLEENKLLDGVSEEEIIKKTEALLPITR